MRRGRFPFEHHAFERQFSDLKKNNLTIQNLSVIISLAIADVAHLVERHLAKVEVASSSLVIRSSEATEQIGCFFRAGKQGAANALPPPVAEGAGKGIGCGKTARLMIGRIRNGAGRKNAAFSGRGA